jgi:hypothetical protein
MLCGPHCSHLSTILNNIVEPESGVPILFNIVDNCEQCEPHSIVQSCFHQYCNNLLAVYTRGEAYIRGAYTWTIFSNKQVLVINRKINMH